ncbi:MAG: prolipoprotein diacylglyceryl transferase [Peptococcaceae bacterium]|nr:prolipoprotein diacylglyceryl transferase [Peptococcaceae bacterium]
MYPVINILGLKVASYGLMNLLGFGPGITLASWRAKKRGISFEQEFLMLIHVCLGVIIGAKLLYLALNIDYILLHKDIIFQSAENLLSYLGGGFVFYGGLAGGIIAAYLYCRHYREPFLKMLEIAVPSIPLIHAMGRIGCFLAGCCYGIPVNSWLGVTFTHSPYAPNGVPLFPVQLLEAGINLIIFIVLLSYARQERRPFQVLGLYLLFYSLSRFILEYFRFDVARGIYGGFSTSQWISILVFAIAIYLFMVKRTKQIPSA